MTTAPTQAIPTTIPADVLRALDRMCTPLHESRLAGATAEADAHSMKVIRDYIFTASEARDVGEGCTPADARMLRAANHGLADENAALREALQFYADGSHFVRVNEDVWDTCSGEPTNFWFDEAETAQIEDGSLAKAALDKHSGDFGGNVADAEISDTMIREFFDSFSSSRSLVSVLYWENALQFARALLATRASEAAPRGTDAQILFERKLTCKAIDSAMALGYRNEMPAPEGYWLAPYWAIGRKQCELEDEVLLAPGPSEAAPNDSLRTALEHIERVALRTRTLSRRNRWIAARARGALDGTEEWRTLDIPRSGDAQKDRSDKAVAQRDALIAELRAALAASEAAPGAMLTDEEIEGAALRYCVHVVGVGYDTLQFECAEDRNNFVRDLAAAPTPNAAKGEQQP